jgi:hypothetical protein
MPPGEGPDGRSAAESIFYSAAAQRGMIRHYAYIDELIDEKQHIGGANALIEGAMLHATTRRSNFE